jgi:peptidoglycan/xylan/chitin deacetylase (PgdA/CDA1 family)
MNLYFGSVRFFKHLILIVVLLIIIALIIALVCLARENDRLNLTVKELEAALSGNTVNTPEEGQNTADVPSDIPPGADSGNSADASFPYQELYPDLYCDNDVTFQNAADKTIYLTFDNGPGAFSEGILDILKKHNIKAAFFVIGRNIAGNETVLQRIVEEGPSLGIHTFSQDFRRIYSSVENYLDDFSRAYELIKEETGISTAIFRFPGGSINGYNSKNYPYIISEMLRRGFTYYDWNITDERVFQEKTPATVTANFFEDFPPYGERGIALIHESAASLYSLENIIIKVQASGYSFAKLTNSTKPIIFAYPRQ